MVKYLFLLNQENLSLAVEEVLALNNNLKHLQHNEFLITNFDSSLFQRLGYTKAVYDFLFSCKKKDLKNFIKSFDWQKHYKTNFKLKLHHFKDLKENDLADFIYRKLKNPRVDLKSPKTVFEIFLSKSNTCFAGRLVYENVENFASRRSHLRPAHHPTSMHPKLARALINLTGIKNGVLYDVFCGSGGILIESGLMNINFVGYDIDKVMLKRAKKNLLFYGIKKPLLKKKDATKITHKVNYIVSDLPYSRGTKKTDLKKLYTNFFKNLKKILVGRAVVMMPHFVDFKKIIKIANLKILNEFSIYVHAALTRKIVVLK